jgi:hypothetical protein
MSQRNTVHESYRLGLGEDDWKNLAFGTSNRRTRNGGSGRPNLSIKVLESSTTDSDYEGSDEEDSSEEEELESSDEEEEQEDEDEGKKPDPTRLFLEYQSLKKCMEKNCRCPKCNGPVEMKVKTLCLACNVMVCCLDTDCGYVDVSELPATAEIGLSKDRERTTDFAINVLYVLGFISCGDGGTEASRLLGLLGLPNDTTMQSRSFGIIEERISPFIQSVTTQVLLENLTEEVRLSFETIPDKDETDVANWKNSVINQSAYNKAKYPTITVSFDMGWQQRSSGKRYSSPSGHAFFIGGLSRKPVAIQVKSKICNYCFAWKKKHPPIDNEADLPVPPHNCTINHVGTSAAMEAAAALEMVIDLFDRQHVKVGKICIDDDASTRSILKWSNADYMKNNNTDKPPQVPKTVGKNKGELHDRPNNGKASTSCSRARVCC